MITIYHLGVSQSDRIVWLMEELQLPYKLEWYDRTESRQAYLERITQRPAYIKAMSIAGPQAEKPY